MRQDKAIKYLRHALHFAGEFSKDRSTKVGAMFLHREDFTTLSVGYNGQPRGCLDDLPERHERPLKYEYAEHGERNGIFNCVRPLLRGSSAVTTEVLTMSSVRAAISVGVAEVWSPRPADESDGHRRALSLLAEVGVSHGFHHGRELATTESGWRTDALNEHLGDAFKSALSARDPQASATIFVSPSTLKPLAEGVSDLPRGVAVGCPCRWHGDERLYWVEDSVRNAIYAAARPILYGSITISTQECCAECLRAVAAVGSKEIVTAQPSPEFEERWAEQYRRSRAMADELGLSILRVPSEALRDPLLLAA
jgi:deoxycytidylate deaminase